MLLNRRPIAKVLGAVTAVVGVSMLLPALVSAYYGEADIVFAILVCCIPMIIAGLLSIKLIPPASSSKLRMRDGFFIVATSWFAMSVLAGIPFVISGVLPNPMDAFFEMASGFTTTGSTILSDVEALPKGLLFWRSFTHWLGGMGILVLTIAILPALGIGGQKIMRAETTGPTMDKINFTINDSAKTLYKLYFGMTVLQIVLLMMSGLSLFDASTHTFGSVGTGGLSIYNNSIAHYGNFAAEMIITFFMIAAGVNFNLYNNLLIGKPLNIFKDTEFNVYMGIIGGSTLFIAIILLIKGFYTGFGEALRYSVFQVASIITTTGYTTADYDIWPLPAKFVLYMLMFVGGCASSTGGGMKVIRVILIIKLAKRGILRRLHPNAVTPIKVDGKTISAETMSGVAGYFVLYMFTMLAGILLISLEDVSLTTAASAVVACLSNIGPGFEGVGPTMNFGYFSNFSKFIFSLLMIAGRLELYTVILMLTPIYWNKRK